MHKVDCVNMLFFTFVKFESSKYAENANETVYIAQIEENETVQNAIIHQK